MADPAPQVRIVLTTAANPDEAARLARTLLEERLAACATVIPGVQSFYRWQGDGEHWKGPVGCATETLLLLKTGLEQLAALEQRLLALHSYQTPEFLVLEVEAGSHSYLAWLTASLRQP